MVIRRTNWGTPSVSINSLLTKPAIEIAHHEETTVRTDRRAPELQPHAAVEIDPTTPIRTRTHWVILEKRPAMPSTP